MNSQTYTLPLAEVNIFDQGIYITVTKSLIVYQIL